MLNLLLSCLLGMVAPQSVPGIVEPTNQVFVKFKDGTKDEQKEEMVRKHLRGSSSVHHYENIPNLSLVAFPSETRTSEVTDLVERLNDGGMFEFVEQDRAFVASFDQVIPNDAGFPQSWGHRNTGQNGGVPNFDMKSTMAWTISQGSPSIRVMIIETGVQMNHPDLNMSEERDFTTGAVNGIPGTGQLNSCDDHGTAVAGVIASRINNSIGTTGLSPLSPVVSAKVGSANVPCDGSWSGQTSWTVNAINWAASNGIRVTNNSNSYGFFSSAMNSAYSATRNSGLVHFASSGNGGTNSISYPAAYSSVNAIGAASRFGQRASFSSYGSDLFVVAPGQSIYTTDRTGSSGYSTGSYATMDGTSFSSPYVAALAALVLSKNSSLTPSQVEVIIRQSTTDMSPSGFDAQTGWGMVNANEALIDTPSLCGSDLNDDGTVNGADLTILLGQWGTCFNCSSDLNGDGQVNGADLSILLGSWGGCD